MCLNAHNDFLFFIFISANLKGKEEGRCSEFVRILSKSLIKTFFDIFHIKEI